MGASRRDGASFRPRENGFSGWSKSFERFAPLVDDEFGRPLEQWQPHDLRRSLVTHVKDERIETDSEVIEMFVNHVSGAARAGVAGVYNRAHLLEPRRALAQNYADWVLSIVGE